MRNASTIPWFDEVASILKIDDTVRKRLVRIQLVGIQDKYIRAVKVRAKCGNLDEHRERLGKIAALSRQLNNLMNNEVVLRPVLDLRALSAEAERFYNDIDALRSERWENGTKISLERRIIWERIFELMVACGLTLGTARKGTAFKLLCVVHAVFGIHAPREETVYKAIIVFKSNGRHQTIVRFPTTPARRAKIEVQVLESFGRNYPEAFPLEEIPDNFAPLLLRLESARVTEKSTPP